MTAQGGSKPLFIVGLPRSGTTLIRNILNQHDAIALTRYESHFLPRLIVWIEQRGGWPAARDGARDDITSIYLTSTIVQDALRREGFEPSGDWVGQAISQSQSVADLCRRLLEPYTRGGPVAYWGDKTPRYLEHLPLLHRTFPDAKFLQIVRDPRDIAVSELMAWGKSPIRSAARWQEAVSHARVSARDTGADYHEIRFEDLVCEPEGTLRPVCSWLEVDYSDTLTVSVPVSDELGQSRQSQTIVSGVVGARRALVSAKTLRRMESVSAPLCVELGYSTDAISSRLSLFERLLLQAHDAVALMRYYLKTRGVAAGLRAMLTASREGA